MPITANDQFARRYFLGERVYGDDFSLAQIKEWYEQEETGYYDLTEARGVYSYGYHALNRLHGLTYLKGRVFDCCLAIGCARGDDVTPLARQVRKFIAIEPAEQWWSDRIGGNARLVHEARDIGGYIAPGSTPPISQRASAFFTTFPMPAMCCARSRA